MLAEFFNEEAKKFVHLDGYLKFGTLGDVFALADAHHGDNAFKRENGLVVGQYEPRNDFTAAFGVCVQNLEQDDKDRIVSFYRVFDEARANAANGHRDAIRQGFYHFDKCYRDHVDGRRLSLTMGGRG